MSSSCYLEPQEYSFLYIQKKYWSYIEDVLLLIYAHFTNIFFHFWGVLNLDVFFVRNAKMVSGLCNL